MKILTMAAASCALLFAAKPSEAIVPVALYDTATPATTLNYTLQPGAQFAGDVFIPTSNGPICNVDGLFVDTTGGTYNITVDFWNNECLGCTPSPVRSETFTVTLPPTLAPVGYILTFPIGATAGGPFTYTPGASGYVGISFHIDPPGCAGAAAPTLVPSYDNVVPAAGVDLDGFSVDIAPQNCCLETGLALLPPPNLPCNGQEWFTFDQTWLNANMLVTLWDCSPQMAMTHGPLSLQSDVMVRKLDNPVRKHKGLLSRIDLGKAKR